MYKGATSDSLARRVTVLLSYGFACAAETLYDGDESFRFLQPCWDFARYVSSPYNSHIYFAGALATAVYFIACGYFTILDYNHASTKIQKDYWPTSDHIFQAAVPQTIMYGIGQMIQWGLWVMYPAEFSTTLPELAPTVLEFGLHMIFCLLIGDFLLYWLHRYMHYQSYLRKHIHSVHHKYSAVFSWAGGWVHPLEDLGTIICQLTPVLLCRPHALTLWFFASFWVLCLIDEHSGHDVWWSPYQLLPFTNRPLGGGAAPHDIHHYKPTKNFGFIFIIWDRLFQTFEPVQETHSNCFVAPYILERRPKASNSNTSGQSLQSAQLAKNFKNE